MKALIQRVSSASVHINDSSVGKIEQGILLLLGIEKEDTFQAADKLLQKILAYRVFSDEEGKMNLNLQQTEGGLLIVSQFTLVADTKKGLRPGFSAGASPQLGEELYNYFIEQAKRLHPIVETGRFGADMQVHLINDGPVTFWLES
ncbi:MULTISPECIES: D-aminoacyl-tRNA deacylase [unclassified Neptuniibacter]|jgi:D-tyrosyl-tRNA(Tyr) deacylase|uniref:D-aminoacyl-tRNA deacylase n=1 Tax=unclassified Neptuniibacter TaxID=2630693 RepID=UPI0026E25F90|nr:MULTISPECIES: D-aminoacyl-tRNA deacylase [unclassified Neptuniibacter]MDO6515463.1 D-aminoacyl-tRNA deacylase [Neptuniibacter sp. 2_MG-2023]MDO6595115.1 D-aminoacyl-tRNA deacylase [Neptuniibacter sp. 1_MG-2023]